ncbi:MAG: MerR family DNA-binding transcriptional regulator [Bifidobacteriaceae bacterium]|jgi:DNA-binding transcriptional MerR regulator|nr:MerR family DNA-binding transcriptional regulator [Bifidobacteriaceae bacterium]
MNSTTTAKAASTSEVASALGVSPATVRRYIKEGFLPEPGWVTKGRRKERGYSPEWVEAALQKLRSEDHT